MKVGDTKQAAILSVVAIGAIGFLIFSILPKGGSPQPNSERQADPAKVEASAKQPDNYPLTLRRDAFSHPSLTLAAQKKAPVTQGEKEPLPPMKGDFSKIKWPTNPTDDHSVDESSNGDSAAPDDHAADSSAKGDPVENTGNSRNPKGETMTQIKIRVEGTVMTDQPLVMLNINGRSVTCRPNDYPVPGLKISGIKSEFISVVHKGKSTKVSVGNEVTL